MEEVYIVFKGNNIVFVGDDREDCIIQVAKRYLDDDMEKELRRYGITKDFTIESYTRNCFAI